MSDKKTIISLVSSNSSFSPSDEQTLVKAATLIEKGEVVALPTETVYGLAGNALDSSAIKKIFSIKNRPSNNPLIVHVSNIEMANGLGLRIPPIAYTLSREFWPGPLTMIFEKEDGGKNILPPEISCGLSSVAVRVPNNKAFLEVIRLSNLPIAAPSANLSGSPSPTKAIHVYDDLKGRIDLIVSTGDTGGEECSVGIESTVIAFEGGGYTDNGNNRGDKTDKTDIFIRILRPGAITKEMLTPYANVIIDDTVYAGVSPTNEEGDSPVRSPGVLYKHYSPKAKVIAIIAPTEQAFLDYVNNINKDNNAISSDKVAAIANPDTKTLFSSFREFDKAGVELIYVRLPRVKGVGLALYNRIVRAAEFNIVNIDIDRQHPK